MMITHETVTMVVHPGQCPTISVMIYEHHVYCMELLVNDIVPYVAVCVVVIRASQLVGMTAFTAQKFNIDVILYALVVY